MLRTLISGLRPSHCGVPYNNLVCSLLESLGVFLTVCAMHQPGSINGVTQLLVSIHVYVLQVASLTSLAQLLPPRLPM